MKALLAAVALVLVLGHAATANAGTSCQQIGDFTYCNDGYGNSQTCQRVGDFTYCN